MTEDEDGDFVHNSGKRVLVGENKFNSKVTNFNSDKNYSVYFHKNKNKKVLDTQKKIRENTLIIVNIFYLLSG